VLLLATEGGLTYFGITQINVFCAEKLICLDIILIALGIITLFGGGYFIYSLVKKP
jgi:hypothetical protein